MAQSIMIALNEAIDIMSDCRYRRTLHSDQGWAYHVSKGNCYDNLVMENFFGIMKQEMYYGRVYYSYEEIKSEIDRYIEYFNKQIIKHKLG